MNYYELFHQSHHFLQYSEDLEVFVINNDVNFDAEVSPFFSKKKFFHGRQFNPFLCKWPFSSEKTENGYLTKVLSITPEYERESLALKILHLDPPSEEHIINLLNFHYYEYTGKTEDFYDFVESVLSPLVEIEIDQFTPKEKEVLRFGQKWVDQKRNEWQQLPQIPQKALQPPTVEVIKEKEEQTTDETKTTLRIQMLIVYYFEKLGYLKTNFHDKTKIAALFSLLLGRNEQNIRTHLGYDTPEFVDSDLKTLLPLFKSLGKQAEPVIGNINKNLERVEKDPNNKPLRKKILQP